MKHLGLTQAQFAKRLGVTKVSVARYEAGRLPRLRVLKEIARLGEVTVTWLLDGSTPEERPKQRQPDPMEIGLIERGHDLCSLPSAEGAPLDPFACAISKAFRGANPGTRERSANLDEYQ